MSLSLSFLQQLASQTQISLTKTRLTALAGGDINQAYHLQNDTVSWFIKLNRADLLPMFIAEAQGLNELAALNILRVPQVISYGQIENSAYLILEYIALKPNTTTSNRLLGQQLAQLHQQKQPFYGWSMENTIGSTPQHNGHYENWLVFWQQQRLQQQLRYAAENGYLGQLQRDGEKLSANLGCFFKNYTPHPSLLHGDLWGGNVASDNCDNPVIFDPACYYGDRETDLAMTELFGGFDKEFYAAYQDYYPLNNGYALRKNLYNLYHILNHLNIFGSGYLFQAESMLARLLAEI